MILRMHAPNYNIILNVHYNIIIIVNITTINDAISHKLLAWLMKIDNV